MRLLSFASLLVLPLLIAGPCHAGEPLKQGERDFAMSHLHASRKLLLDAITGLSPAQWKWKPAPERWSVAEAAEHILRSEEQLFSLLTSKVLTGPDVASGLTRAADEQFMARIRDRSQRAEAPAEMRPTGRFATPGALATEFKKVRDNTIRFVQTTGEPLRYRLYESPMGKMDAYQILLLIAAHTERHVAQIEEVKASSGFPKK